NGRTRFWYEANGNVAAIEDANGVTTKAAYNAIGQRTSVNDPNQGTWSFAYNGLGEVLNQTDARGIVTSMTYDKLSRPLTRNATIDVTGDNVADTVADSWSYDPANAKGALSVAQRAINSALERSTTTVYDALARPVLSHVAQAGAPSAYVSRTKYDSYYGRPVGQEFPNGEAVQALYGNYGHGLAEKDPVTGTEYRRTNSVNARGQATQETFGNGVVLNPQYQWQTGQLTELKYSKNGSDLRKLGYGYDVFGNLKRQTLNTNQSQEDYSYDELHRLVQSIRSGAASGTVNYGFDAVGNFTKKTDFSTSAANAYSYTGGTCGGGANAVKQIALAAGGTRTYCYDANGNLTGDNAGLSVKYDHMGMTTVAQRGALRDDFRYGADGSRTRSWGSDGSRIYLPGYEHRLDTNETKVYVGDYAVITNGTAGRKVEYLLKDRLGSVDAVANSAGAITETRGYDAFGKPRSGTWADLTPPKLGSTNVTPKGFTQHEHLNQLELIHMNGRVFDYNVGRFTGVDPVIQFPLNSQSLNPYSYILNNPLSGTDPTGYCAQSDTGTRVRQCVTVEVQMKDGSTKNMGTFNLRSSADLARASMIALPGLNKSDNGAKDGQAKATESRTGNTAGNNENLLISVTSRRSDDADKVPQSVVASCAGYVASAGSFSAGCPVDRGIETAARTQVSQSGPVNPNFVNQSVAEQSSTIDGVVHTDLAYEGNVDERLIPYAENNWTGNGKVMQLQMTRRPEGNAGLKINMIDTPAMAEMLDLCSCERAYNVGGRTDIAGKLIYLNKDISFEQQKSSLTHELGHYFLGYGHPSQRGHFLFGGILDYQSKRVKSFDRDEYRRKYISGGVE
ncbi:MAG: hypothetical protein E6Q50_06025, partial [Lysobacter sp.]